MNDDIRENKTIDSRFCSRFRDRGRMDERNGPNAENGGGAARAGTFPTGSRRLYSVKRMKASVSGTHWTEIQTAFVDEPRKAVEQADNLVAEAIQRLAKIFADERAKLEHEWSRGEDQVSTEDLRVALRRYCVVLRPAVVCLTVDMRR